MLVSPTPFLPAGEEWAIEVKWDGMRALVSIGPVVRVHSRHGHDHTAAFLELGGPRVPRPSGESRPRRRTCLPRPDHGTTHVRTTDREDPIEDAGPIARQDPRGFGAKSGVMLGGQRSYKQA
jgi:hypothetical protein